MPWKTIAQERTALTVQMTSVTLGTQESCARSCCQHRTVQTQTAMAMVCAVMTPSDVNVSLATQGIRVNTQLPLTLLLVVTLSFFTGYSLITYLLPVGVAVGVIFTAAAIVSAAILNRVRKLHKEQEHIYEEVRGDESCFPSLCRKTYPPGKCRHLSSRVPQCDNTLSPQYVHHFLGDRSAQSKGKATLPWA